MNVSVFLSIYVKKKTTHNTRIAIVRRIYVYKDI